jgi:ABC-type lipoprotein export system ATPase subunit
MFEAIRLDEALAAEYGLEPVLLDRLSDVVAVAGPNGAGKTRLLRLIKQQLAQTRTVFDRLSKIARAQIGELSKEEGDLLNTQLHYLTEGAASSAEATTFGLTFLLFGFLQHLQGGESELPEEIVNSDTLKGMRERFQNNLERELHELAGRIRFGGGLPAALRRGAWPRLVALSSIPDEQRNPFSQRSFVSEFRLYQYPDAKLHEAATISFLARHPDWAPDHTDHINRASGYIRTVSALLGMEVGGYSDGPNILATLDGRVVKQDELSAGQRLLVRWAEAIHENVDDVRQAIVFLDEPELHLHPSILVDVVKSLRSLEPAQIWIATHCVPLLASLDPRQIIYVERGRATPAGNRIDHVLEGLLGGSDGVGRLRTFLGDAASLAFHQFAAQSLVEPAAVDLRPNDPQAMQFSTRISALLAGGDEVRVLEYAAGRGRLIEALAATPSEGREHLRYHAYNTPDYTSADDEESCRLQLQRLHGVADTSKLYWTDLREHQRRGSNKMHAAVLCNVLHEIPPQIWPQLMTDLRECLRDDGHLLILEDQLMTGGELPHDRGFLVLDDVELRALFSLSSPEAEGFQYSPAYDGRLSLAEIPALFLDRCRGECVREALQLLRKRALGQIEALRGKAGQKIAPHRRGRQHAFFALLHTNATLALSSLA